MTLLEYLVLGSYAYTTLVAGTFLRLLLTTHKNHISHLEAKVKALQDTVDKLVS